MAGLTIKTDQSRGLVCHSKSFKMTIPTSSAASDDAFSSASHRSGSMAEARAVRSGSESLVFFCSVPVQLGDGRGFVTSLLLVRMSPNTVCVRACALVLAVVTCPFVITAY